MWSDYRHQRIAVYSKSEIIEVLIMWSDYRGFLMNLRIAVHREIEI